MPRGRTKSENTREVVPDRSRPEETAVDAHLGFASRIYGHPPDFRTGWKGVYVQVAPPNFTRGGVLIPIEGDRWMVTLVGGDRD